jgi:5-methylcytosine-specific restriction endonuclease McrA
VKRTALKQGPSKRHRVYLKEFQDARAAVVVRAHGRCEIRVWDICEGRVHHIHHQLRRSQGGSNDLDNLLAACNSCHTYLHQNPTEAYAKGWLIRSGS